MHINVSLVSETSTCDFSVVFDVVGDNKLVQMTTIAELTLTKTRTTTTTTTNKVMESTAKRALEM